VFLWRVSLIIGILLGWADEEAVKEENDEAPSELASDDGETTPRKLLTYTPVGSQASADSLPMLSGTRSSSQKKIKIKEEDVDVKRITFQPG
jgi:hypothetical protein